VIQCVVWLYYCFDLSNRDMKDLLMQRDIKVYCQSIRRWRTRFGRAYGFQIVSVRLEHRSAHELLWWLARRPIETGGILGGSGVTHIGLKSE
jgi:transposase-like protein